MAHAEGSADGHGSKGDVVVAHVRFGSTPYTPGFIVTPILEPTSGTEVEQTMIGLTPRGRLDRPDEVAAGMASFGQHEASFVTGPEIYINGGYIAR